jgi:hypothetical protein
MLLRAGRACERRRSRHCFDFHVCEKINAAQKMRGG